MKNDLIAVQDKVITVHSLGSYLVQPSSRIRCFRIKVMPEILLPVGAAVQPTERDQNVNVPAGFSTGI